MVRYGVHVTKNDGYNSDEAFQEGHTYYTAITSYDGFMGHNVIYKFTWTGEDCNLYLGKTTDARLSALIDDYQQRLKHYIPFEFVVVPDIKNAKSLTQDQLKTAEGEAILARLTPAMDVLLLDEHGREFRSIEYADFLQRKMAAGRDLVLIIGGAYGFSQAVYDRANGKISLSQMTFSHQMIRLMAIEQIYRAMTILRGEPYHHE